LIKKLSQKSANGTQLGGAVEDLGAVQSFHNYALIRTTAL